ncbi:MAG: hypothetical protein QNK23_08190 [Crocinitomicaceae bacterium]|nr:hypothetical protein [Crocinitomicaceae bacterium]
MENNLGFEIHHNGKHICRAGVEDKLFVVSCIANSVSRKLGDKPTDLSMQIGGLISESFENIVWSDFDLKLGDTIDVEVIDDKFSPYTVTDVWLPPEPEALTKEEIAHKRIELQKLKEELAEHLDEDGELRI